MESARPLKREDILPIDKGWAWVVVTAGSIIFSLTAGQIKCEGIILVELIERLPHIPTSQLLWAVSTITVMSMVGPVISFLLTKLNNRTVILGGLCLMVFGFLGLAYATSLVAIILLYSVPLGAGIPAVYLPAVLTADQYFNKRKALAYGLVGSGSGFGTLVIPYMLRGLFDHFTFQEAMFYNGGFVLQYMCIACLMRPMSMYENIHRKKLALLDEIPKDEGSSEGKVENTSSVDDKFLSKSVNDIYQVNGLKPARSLNLYAVNPVESLGFLSVGNLATSVSSGFKVEKNSTQNATLWNESSDSPAGDTTVADNENKGASGNKFNWRLFCNPKMLMFATSMFMYCMGGMVVFQCLPSLAKESGVPKSTVALVFTVVGSLEIVFRAANGYLADKHIVTGYTQYMATVFITGCSVLIGGILSGLSELFRATGVALIRSYNGAEICEMLISSGLVVAVFGMAACGQAVFNLFPVVLSELLGPENLTTSMGIMLGTEGMAVLLTTVVVGNLYDATKSWQLVVLFISGCMIMGSVILLPYWIYTGLTRTWRRDNRKAEDTIATD